jgi:hypothetical protein
MKPIVLYIAIYQTDIKEKLFLFCALGRMKEGKIERAQIRNSNTSNILSKEGILLA